MSSLSRLNEGRNGAGGVVSTCRQGIVAWCRAAWGSWDRFWFTPSDAATLGMIRILAGAMLLYTHAVWGMDLLGFFGTDGRLSPDFSYRFHDSRFAWSHLYWLESPTSLWVAHVAALGVFAALTVGFQSRFAALLSYLLTVSYAHRGAGGLYGLDQINGYLALYLTLGACGDAYSVDSWRRVRTRNAGAGTASPRSSTNVAIRLMQIHLCVIYLFAGLGKLLGESWWDGTALWGAFANWEYQTLDMTWTSHSLALINFLTHITLFWEISYAALVWPRLTRPIVLFLAIPLHLGIALSMGMITFGLIMIVANFSFVSPQVVRRMMGHLQGGLNRAANVEQRSPTERERDRVPGRKPPHRRESHALQADRSDGNVSIDCQG